MIAAKHSKVIYLSLFVAAVALAVIAATAAGETKSFGSGPDCPKYGTGNADVYFMGNGNDCAWMDSGADQFYGGADNDFGTGQGGNDLVDGGDGHDYVEGEFGSDETKGGPGPDDSDVLNGDGGDIARGGDGNNDYCHVDTSSGVIIDSYDNTCEYLILP
jgi:Ca2+-binding RTX toxin-like protein